MELILSIYSVDVNTLLLFSLEAKLVWSIFTGMISDEELISLDKRGLIPGPDEDEDSFLKRISVIQEFYHNPRRFLEDVPFPLESPVAKHRMLWSRLQLKEIFNIEPDWLPCFFYNQK